MKRIVKFNTDKMNIQKGETIEVIEVYADGLGGNYLIVERLNGKNDIFCLAGERISQMTFGEDEAVIKNCDIVENPIGKLEFFCKGKLVAMIGGEDDKYFVRNLVKTRDPKTGLHGIYNFHTKMQVVPNIYCHMDIVYECTDLLAFLVSTCDGYGIIAADGKVIVPVEFPLSSLQPYNGIWPVIKKQKWLLYANNGEKITKEPVTLYHIEGKTVLFGERFNYRLYSIEGKPMIERPIKLILTIGPLHYKVMHVGEEKLTEYKF